MDKEASNQIKYQTSVRMDLNALIQSNTELLEETKWLRQEYKEFRQEQKKLYGKVDSLEAIVKLNYTPRKT